MEERQYLISRQAAIKALVEFTHLEWKYLKLLYPVLEVLEQLPSAQPERKTGEWIPCSERLPEKSQLCLVTEKCVSGLEVHTRYFNKREDGGYWSGWKDTSVYAWMPLPEPYAERRTDGV